MQAGDRVRVEESDEIFPLSCQDVREMSTDLKRKIITQYVVGGLILTLNYEFLIAQTIEQWWRIFKCCLLIA